MVDLDGVVVLDHTAVVQLFMDLVFAQRVLDVVVLDLVRPAIVEMVDLARDFTAILQVEGFVDLAEATFAQNREDQVLVVQDCEGLAPMDATVFRLFLVADAFVFDQVGTLLLLNHL